MKAFFSFMIRWVIPVLGLIALSLIIWFVGPLLDVLVPQGRRWALIVLMFAVWIAYRVFRIIQARRQAAEVMRSLAADAPVDPNSVATAEELATLRQRMDEALALLVGPQGDARRAHLRRLRGEGTLDWKGTGAGLADYLRALQAFAARIGAELYPADTTLVQPCHRGVVEVVSSGFWGLDSLLEWMDAIDARALKPLRAPGVRAPLDTTALPRDLERGWRRLLLEANYRLPREQPRDLAKLVLFGLRELLNPHGVRSMLNADDWKRIRKDGSVSITESGGRLTLRVFDAGGPALDPYRAVLEEHLTEMIDAPVPARAWQQYDFAYYIGRMASWPPLDDAGKALGVVQPASWAAGRRAYSEGVRGPA